MPGEAATPKVVEVIKPPLDLGDDLENLSQVLEMPADEMWLDIRPTGPGPQTSGTGGIKTLLTDELFKALCVFTHALLDIYTTQVVGEPQPLWTQRICVREEKKNRLLQYRKVEVFCRTRKRTAEHP